MADDVQELKLRNAGLEVEARRNREDIIEACRAMATRETLDANVAILTLKMDAIKSTTQSIQSGISRVAWTLGFAILLAVLNLILKSPLSRLP